MRAIGGDSSTALLNPLPSKSSTFVASNIGSDELFLMLKLTRPGFSSSTMPMLSS